jgi:glucokinase
MNSYIGIDVGGTNIKAVALTPAGRALIRALVPGRDLGPESWKDSAFIAYEAVRLTLNLPANGVGVAAPGLAARDQRSIAIMPGRLPGLAGLDWQEFLKVAGPVPVMNDAQAALLGEMWRGAARGAQNAVLLTLGTGVGGAAMVDGRLLRGHIGRAGHLGHLSLNPAGPLDIANTPGSLEDAIGDHTVEARTGGEFKTTSALVAASLKGHAEARRVWGESVRALAAGVASLINILDPEVVVIGGGIARAGGALFRPLARHLKRFEWRPDGRKARIVPAKLGEWAGAMGAAWNTIYKNS